MKLNINTLEKYKEEGWLISNNHPSLPLVIWNYSNKTQYDGKWDTITLLCRGLVTDLDGNIVAGGLKKFFNYEEGKHIETFHYEVYEKLDGSLIIGFWYKHQWVVASRGSFTSTQAELAKEIFNNKLEQAVYNGCIPGHTYYFELTGKKNKIVVDYPYDAKLTIIAAFNTTTLGEVKIDSMTWEGFNLAAKFEPKPLLELLSRDISNHEGYVIKFASGDRCKIKFKEYLMLHALITNTSSYDIWEAMMNGIDLSVYTDNIPDEFHNWVKQLQYKLISQFDEIEKNCLDIYEEYKHFGKKEFALAIVNNKYSSILFAMYNGKEYSKIIWKMIKPEYDRLSTGLK